jgi:hypothetical protein
VQEARIMSIEKGRRLTGYTVGEIKGLLAPVLGCDPDDLGDIVIIAEGANQAAIGVHTTFFCQLSPIHWQVRAIDLMANGIKFMGNGIYEDATHHGPDKK